MAPLTIRLGLHTGPAVTAVVGGATSTGLMKFSVFGEGLGSRVGERES